VISSSLIGATIRWQCLELFDQELFGLGVHGDEHRLVLWTSVFG
jgi:hypothetical protein